MKSALSLFFCFSSLFAFAQPYDFSQIDNLLESNLDDIYADKVVCMVKKDGELIYYKALGGYDSTSNALIASVSKSLSAAVLMSLDEDGILSLDDSIGQYLPLFTQTGKGHPTLRQCFSHTAGFPANSDFESAIAASNLAAASDSIALNTSLLYQPGNAFLYGGVSMHVAGRVAEVASGQPWWQLFSQRLVQPLGLQSTFFTSLLNPRIAGGIISNPSDLMKFAEMLLHEGSYNGVQVLSPASVETMWNDQTNHALQLYSPYPSNPVYNNPYDASTIYYGIGTWLDVFNPQTDFQEQISGAGAFGSLFWVDRCRGISGLIFTSTEQQISTPITHQIVDVVRAAIPSDCAGTTATTQIPAADWKVFPNPASHLLTLQTAETQFCGVILGTTGHRLLHFENEKTVDVSALPSGLFVLQLSTPSGQSLGQTRFVKSGR